MSICHFTRPPIRAIEVRQVDTEDRWQAVFAGDEWTPSMRFEPPMRFALLRSELLNAKERRGLPIVIIAPEAGEVAA